MSVKCACLSAWQPDIRVAVSVPVVVVGRIKTPSVAEELLRANKADYVCLSRALISDPFCPAKAYAGLVQDIVPCIACNECLATVHNHSGVACTMNPMASRELTLKRLWAAPTARQRIVVIGASVAGMAAALTVARRGHGTHLIERSIALGGQLILTPKPPHREELESAPTYFRRAVSVAGVEVHAGREWSPEELARLEPDRVIVAIGAASRRLIIPGIDEPPIAFGWEVIAGTVVPGRRCVVVGEGLVGIEVADFLAEREHKVTIVARSELLGIAVWADRVYFLDRSRDLRIRVLTVSVRR